MKKDIKQNIIVRKDLNMRKGKMIAQGAHASMKVISDIMVYYVDTIPFDLGGGASTVKVKSKGLKLDTDGKEYILDWLQGNFKKIALGAESLDDLMWAANEAKSKGIPVSIIEDEGLTEFNGRKTITSIAIGPYYSDEIDKITKESGIFKLL